jgi:predicted DNA-binding helix-hairpin-helix protein
MTILDRSVSLTAAYRLKRIYYSAFSPTGHPSSRLPDRATPLVREHRLYQADWLLRFYEFTLPEIGTALDGGMLDLGIDPKFAWALRHRETFPLDVNTADRALLLRVPGFGVKAVDRIIRSRRTGALRIDDVGRLTGALRRALPFIVTPDHHPGATLDAARLRERLAPQPKQLALF